MTVAQKTFMKANWITFTNLVLLLGLVVQQSQWQQKVDSHLINESIHRSLGQGLQIFVPRVELDNRLKNIENSQNAQNVTQQKILDLLLKNKN
jgi:hypothetical protein